MYTCAMLIILDSNWSLFTGLTVIRTTEAFKERLGPVMLFKIIWGSSLYRLALTFFMKLVLENLVWVVHTDSLDCIRWK